MLVISLFRKNKTSGLHLGDCLEILKDYPDNHFDSVVTDPPYGLAFMNKKWDYDVPSIEIWQEVLRVLKPGGHLLSFGGSRTYHRMACRIEDAGFEIRDCIMWLYGSGFPKSLDISKAIDKQAGAERKIVGTKIEHNIKGSGDNSRLMTSSGKREGININITEPATEEAKQWEGWGTALKPAHEPIIMARKPLSEKNIAENILKWGVGGINIDECRIELGPEGKTKGGCNSKNSMWFGEGNKTKEDNSIGRFPANLILDEEAGQLLDQQSGISQSKSSYRGLQHSGRHGGLADLDSNIKEGTNTIRGHDDLRGASRFFYCAKASKKERNIGLEDFETKKVSDGRQKEVDSAFQRGKTERHNTHPTVKPVKLMEYLVKLITPKNGIVLDPFMGSGSTGIAAKSLGFKFCGIEQNNEYFRIAEARIESFT